MDEVLPEEVRPLEWKDLPNELINLIVAYCSGPTLLQLRLVSKGLKDIVNTSKRFKKVVGEVCVRLDSKTLPIFIMDMDAADLPFQDFYIDTGTTDRRRTPTPPPSWFMDSELLNRFIERFSSTIRKLEVTRMYCGTVDGEMPFYESLDNLRELEVTYVEPVKQVRPLILPVPGRMGRSLKILTLWQERNSGDYLIDWVKSFPSLEEITTPEHFGRKTTGREAYGGATLKFDHCYPYIFRLGAERHLPNLRVLDLSCEHLDLSVCSEQDKQSFHKLLTEREGLRFRNVSAKMLEEVRTTCVTPEWKPRMLEAFKRTVESLIGMHEMLQEEGFETLESLSFDASENVDGSGEFGPLRLPGLRKVVLWMENFDVMAMVDQRFLDRVCLPEEPRLSVEYLELEYNVFVEGMPLNPQYLDQGFPNLRSVSLDLGGFSGEQMVEVIEVMSRKPFLEEMSLTTSRGTPEDAFFGVEDSLRFPSLKKLSLGPQFEIEEVGAAETMSDRSLQLFGRMELSHLSIKGPGWESVTNEGVRGLLGGTFERTVVSVKLWALEVKGDDERRKLLNDVKEIAGRNKVRLT